MKKVLKTGLISFLILIIALIATPYLFKGKIIKLVQEQINKNINANVSFKEDISLSLIKSFPNFTLEIEDIKIIGKDTFKYDTLAQIENLSLNMDIMSVISGSNITINRVYLSRPRLNIKVLKDGKANYDITYPDSSSSVKDEEKVEYTIALQNLEIEEGTMSYDDQSMKFHMGLSNINSELKGDFGSSQFVLNTITSIGSTDMSYGGISYISKVKTQINSEIEIDLDKMLFTLKNNAIVLNSLDLKAEGWYQLLEEDSDMDLTINATNANIKTLLSLIPNEFLPDLNGVTTNGDVGLNAFVKGKLTEKSIPSFGLNLKVINGTLKYPDLSGSVRGININSNVTNPGGNADRTNINITNFHANINGDILDAKMLLKTPISDPDINIEVKGDIDLANIKKSIKLETRQLNGKIKANINANGKISSIKKEQYQDFDADGKLSLMDFYYKPSDEAQDVKIETMSFDFSPKYVNLEELKGIVGKSDFLVSGRLENFYGYLFGDDKLEGIMKFSSNYFNLNPFLSNEEEDNNNPSAEDSVAIEAIDIPDNINLVLTSSISTLIYDNLKLQDAKGEIKAKDKKLYLNNIYGKIFGGSVQMSGIYDSKIPQSPFTDMDVKVNNFNIQEAFNYLEIIRKLGPISKYVDGLFSAHIKIASNLGNNLSPDYNSLTGEGSIKLSQAVIKGFSVLDEIGDKLKIDALKNLELKDISFGIKIKDGKIELEDTLRVPFKNNILKFTGFSKLDQTLHYSGLVEIPREQFGNTNALLKELSSKASNKGFKLDLASKIPILMNIGGTFTKPSISFSLNEAKKSLYSGIKGQIKNQVEEKKEEVKEKLTEKKDEAKEKLNQEKEKKKQELLAAANKQVEGIKSLAKTNAEKARASFYQQADNLINNSKSKSFLEQKAAEKSAKEIRKKGDQAHDKIIAEGNQKSNTVLENTQTKINSL